MLDNDLGKLTEVEDAMKIFTAIIKHKNDQAEKTKADELGKNKDQNAKKGDKIKEYQDMLLGAIPTETPIEPGVLSNITTSLVGIGRVVHFLPLIIVSAITVWMTNNWNTSVMYGLGVQFLNDRLPKITESISPAPGEGVLNKTPVETTVVDPPSKPIPATKSNTKGHVHEGEYTDAMTQPPKPKSLPSFKPHSDYEAARVGDKVKRIRAGGGTIPSGDYSGGGTIVNVYANKIDLKKDNGKVDGFMWVTKALLTFEVIQPWSYETAILGDIVRNVKNPNIHGRITRKEDGGFVYNNQIEINNVLYEWTNTNKFICISPWSYATAKIGDTVKRGDIEGKIVSKSTYKKEDYIYLNGVEKKNKRKWTTVDVSFEFVK